MQPVLIAVKFSGSHSMLHLDQIAQFQLYAFLKALLQFVQPEKTSLPLRTACLLRGLSLWM